MGKRGGWGPLDSPPSCLRLWFFEDQKVSNNFFDLTYGCYNVIQCQSFLRDTYEVSTCTLWKENTKKKLIFGVETQPQATAGRKIPNEDNKKGRCHVCTCKRDQKSRQKCSKCNLFVCNDHAETTVICSNCIL